MVSKKKKKKWTSGIGINYHIVSASFGLQPHRKVTHGIENVYIKNRDRWNGVDGLVKEHDTERRDTIVDQVK